MQFVTWIRVTKENKVEVPNTELAIRDMDSSTQKIQSWGSEYGAGETFTELTLDLKFYIIFTIEYHMKQ
jgi:hypothetical protein